MSPRNSATPPQAIRHPGGRVRVLLWAILDTLRDSFAKLLRISEQRKLQIYTEMFADAEFANLDYWLEIIFSISIATLGLIINSPAVVIGAMLISPLMGPIIASGLAIALGDFYLGFKSIANIAGSIVGSILLAAAIAWMLPFRTPTAEILSRVQPTLLDLGVAILSGAAGAIVACRGGRGGGVTALPGVAVAVALMPPLGVVGFGIGIGWDWGIVRGGGLLFLTNLAAIILSSFVVFFSVRMDKPHVRAAIDDWVASRRESEPFYEAIERTPLRRVLGKVGTPGRRVAVLVVFLGMVSIPLEQTLVRLLEEAHIRLAVLNELHRFIPREAIFREDLDILPERVQVRVVAAEPQELTAEKKQELQRRIQEDTGRNTQLTIIDVATRSELLGLSQRMSAMSPPVLASLEEVRSTVMTRLQPALDSTWPSERAPLAHYQVTLSPNAPAMRIELSYLSDEELGELGQQAIQKSLAERLDLANLAVEFDRVARTYTLGFSGQSIALATKDRAMLGEITATLRRLPELNCVMLLPSGKEGKPSARDLRRGEQIRKFLLEEQKVAPNRLETQPGEVPPGKVLLKLSLPSARTH